MRYDTGCANAASVAALLAVQIHLGAVGVFESDVDLVRLERKRPGLGFAVSQIRRSISNVRALRLSNALWRR
jgi:hypothetical protein